jgi:uncharacterized membrane protein YecN with MAPEG domain
MPLPITAVTAAILALLLLGLAVDTVRQRFRTRASFGYANDDRLTRASRAHGNLAEHAPIVLILLSLLEYAEANADTLMGLSLAFIVGRVLHAIGLYTVTAGEPPLTRSIGVVSTWAVMAALAAWTLYKLFA